MDNTETRDGLTFDQWLKEVDQILVEKTGFGHEDLVDFPSYDCWYEGATPEDGAEECLEWNDVGSLYCTRDYD